MKRGRLVLWICCFCWLASPSAVKAVEVPWQVSRAGELFSGAAGTSAGNWRSTVAAVGEAWSAVLKARDPMDPGIREFARKYKGLRVCFPAAIACVSRLPGKNVLLLRGGAYGDAPAGPDFQIVSPEESPVYLENVWLEPEEGADLMVTARIGGYSEETGILELEPESLWYLAGSEVLWLMSEEIPDGETLRQIQAALNRAGYDCGTPDGVAGRRTREAAGAFRADRGLGSGGLIDRELAAWLRVPLGPDLESRIQVYPPEEAELMGELKERLSVYLKEGVVMAFWEEGQEVGNTQAAEFADMTQEEILEKVGGLFTMDQYRSGVLASVSLAQFILESYWGKSQLSQLANNLFGIKCSASGNNWEGSTWDEASYCRIQTSEEMPDGSDIRIMANFRAYPSIADHSAYLTHARAGKYLRYGGLQGCRDYREAAAILYAGGYATAHDYASVLCDLIERYDLTRFDLK